MHGSRAGPDGQTLLGETATRTLGLLVDQEFGLLTYAPVYVLALLGREGAADRRDGTWRCQSS